MAASITVHLQIFNCPHLTHFSTDLDETGIKIHGLLRSFILNIEIIGLQSPLTLHMDCSQIEDVHWRHRSRAEFGLVSKLTFSKNSSRDTIRVSNGFE